MLIFPAEVKKRIGMTTARFFAAIIMLMSTIASANEAGFQLDTFEDTKRNRPVAIDWWYPVENQPAEFFDYGFGQGTVVEAGSIAPGNFPLIVFSHGALGAARNYSWLAETLARKGYVVAGVSHFGESYVHGPQTVDPEAVLQSWERPLDISAAITYILSHSRFAQSINAHQIGFIGHSSGGATAMSLAGVLFDGNKIAKYCDSNMATNDRGCDYADAANEDEAKPDQQAVPAIQSYADPRIQVLVALDPALGPGFFDYSKVDPALELLIVGSVDNDFLPFKHHAKAIAASLPNANTHWLKQGAGHFVYLNECTQDLKANGVPLCVDRTGASRSAIHAELRGVTLQFLDNSFSITRGN